MVNSYLVGCKERFALEIYTSDISSNYGTILVWIKSKFIGNKSEAQIIGTVCTQLKRLTMYTDSNSTSRFTSLAPEKLFEELENEETGTYMCSFGESYDQFSVFGFCSRNKFYLVWKLEESEGFPEPSYPQSVQIDSIEVDEVLRVLREAKSLLSIKL